MARRTLFTGSQELCDSRSIYVPILRPTALEIATIREDHFGLHCSCIALPTGGRHRRERVNKLQLIINGITVFWNRQISFQIRLFIPFQPHLKTLLLGFISPFFWLLKLLCNLTTCRSFSTSLSGSISSSVTRVFAILLLTCQFYFHFRHRTHQMKRHNAFVWLHATRIRRIAISVVTIKSWSFSSKLLFIKNINDLI